MDVDKVAEATAADAGAAATAAASGGDSAPLTGRKRTRAETEAPVRQLAMLQRKFVVARGSNNGPQLLSFCYRRSTRPSSRCFSHTAIDCRSLLRKRLLQVRARRQPRSLRRPRLPRARPLPLPRSQLLASLQRRARHLQRAAEKRPTRMTRTARMRIAMMARMMRLRVEPERRPPRARPVPLLPRSQLQPVPHPRLRLPRRPLPLQRLQPRLRQRSAPRR